MNAPVSCTIEAAASASGTLTDRTKHDVHVRQDLGPITINEPGRRAE